MDSIANSGFTIYAVKSQNAGQNLPLPDPTKVHQPLRESQMYVDAEVINQHYQMNKSRPLNFSGADEAELEKALKESMKTFEEEDRRNGNGGNGGAADSEDGGGSMVGQVLNQGNRTQNPKNDKPDFQAFKGAGVTLGSGGDNQAAAASSGSNPGQQNAEMSGSVDPQSEEYQALMAAYGDDPEMITAILASQKEAEIASIDLKPEPDASVDQQLVVTLQLRCPDGSRLIRRFLKEQTTVVDIINYVKKEKGLSLTHQVTLLTTFPKKQLTNVEQTLKEIGFGKQESLIVQL